jgi:lipopolysaccharide cholinephosphotransferase
MNFDLLFPDLRENGDTLIKQCQHVMLRMLKILDYLCEKHQIEYFLIGGSLLGAIRHKGFIPWDDDLDIGMTRRNYEKFLESAVQDLPPDIFFQNYETDVDYPACEYVEARLRDKYSSYTRHFNETDTNKEHRHDGIQLDIFVYDKAFLPNNFLIYALNRFLIFFRNKGNERRAKTLKFIQKYVPFPFVYASSFMCNKEFRKRSTYKTEKELSHLIRVQFEDMEVFIPQGWDSTLKRQYGDYMKLPPLQAQKGHHGAELPDPFTPCKHKEILHWVKEK